MSNKILQFCPQRCQYHHTFHIISKKYTKILNCLMCSEASEFIAIYYAFDVLRDLRFSRWRVQRWLSSADVLIGNRK